MSKRSFFSLQLRQAKASAVANQHQRALRAALIHHPAVKETFNLLPASLRGDAWLQGSEWDNSVHMGVSLRDLSGFKDRSLQRAIEPFLTPEWQANTHDYTSSTTPNRDFKFTRTVYLTREENAAIARHPSARWLKANERGYMVPDRLTLSVGIYAYVKADSPTCRIVVTGVTERVVKEETKEIVCE